MEWWKWLGEFGLAGLIFGAFIMVLRHMMTQQKSIMSDAREERKNWQDAVNKATSALDKHSEQAEKGREMTNEAHRYQREEHKEMATCLVKVAERANHASDTQKDMSKGLADVLLQNGELIKANEKICRNLDEQYHAIKALNGKSKKRNGRQRRATK